MELRQLRYFLTLAEELHFGRAAAREHIVQSALSQQIQRLERELGVTLLERTTHRVRLTRAGEVFVAGARGVLRDVEQAVATTRQASADAAVIRVAVGDSSLDSMPQVLRHVQYNHPDLVVHRIEAPVPVQYRMLAEHSLDVGIGNASHAPPGIGSELFRLDPLGVLITSDHRLADASAVPVADLAGERVLLPEDTWAPEFTGFVADSWSAAGVALRRYSGSVQSVRAAAELVIQEGCVAPVPRSCDLSVPGIRWLPLQPVSLYPWSILWRSQDGSASADAVLTSARVLAAKLGWLTGPKRGAPGQRVAV